MLDYLGLATNMSKLRKEIEDSIGEKVKELMTYVAKDDWLGAIPSLTAYVPRFVDLKHNLSSVFQLLERIDVRFKGLAESTDRLLRGDIFDLYPSPSQLSKYLDTIAGFYQTYHEPYVKKLEILDEEERLRLNEAYHSFIEACYWSSIVNCAVVLEKRLFVILTRRNRQFLIEKSQHLRFMFGQLIEVYVKSPHEFNDCIPKEHVKLLELINTYRIPSAHAKEFSPKPQDASAVFDLTMSFLLDNKCQPPKKRGPRRSGNNQ